MSRFVLNVVNGEMAEQCEPGELGESGESGESGQSGEDFPKRRRPHSRARTISIKRLSKRELERGKMLWPEVAYERPRTRAECLHGPHAERPCPFASCKHHLAIDVNERTGSIKLNFPDIAIEDMPETCALDIADRGGITLEEVGEIMNVCRERIRQVETRGLAKIRALVELASLTDYVE